MGRDPRSARPGHEGRIGQRRYAEQEAAAETSGQRFHWLVPVLFQVQPGNQLLGAARGDFAR